MPKRSPVAVLALSAGCLLATAAEARRPFAPAMSCAALRSLVEERGAVVISTSPTTYDRFVADSRSCERTQRLEPAWIRSADQADCGVGYTCREYMRDDW